VEYKKETLSCSKFVYNFWFDSEIEWNVRS